jgi:P22_AR N-terminal domain
MELARIPFRNDFLDSAKDERGAWTSVKRICENIGISFPPQQTKLQNSKWATVTMIVTVGGDGKCREMLMVHHDSLPMWLATINPVKIKDKRVRELLEAYQVECAQTLRDHFFGHPQPEPQPQVSFTFEEISKLIASTIAATLEPITKMFQTIIAKMDKVQTRSLEEDSTIGSRGAAVIRGLLKEYASARGEGNPKMEKKIRSAAEMELRVAVQFTGTGRRWANMPVAKWPDAMAKLEEFKREIKRDKKFQMNLPGVN